jgi:hypothetical protein
MNMKSIPPTAPAEQVVCGDAADGFQVKLIYPKPESIATRCDLPPFAIPLISWKSSLRLI